MLYLVGELTFLSIGNLEPACVALYISCFVDCIRMGKKTPSSHAKDVACMKNRCVNLRGHPLKFTHGNLLCRKTSTTTTKAAMKTTKKATIPPAIFPALERDADSLPPVQDIASRKSHYGRTSVVCTELYGALWCKIWSWVKKLYPRSAGQ